MIVAGKHNLYPYCIVLFCISQAAFLAGVYHGYVEFMPEIAQLFLWRLVLGFIGVAGLFLLYILVEKQSRNFKAFVHTVFGIVYFGTAFYTQEFMFSMAAYLSIVVVVFVTSMRKSGFKYMMLFSLLTIIAAGLQLSNFKLHEFFTSDDMYHLVQTVGCYYFYKHARVNA